ncbi:MAG: hypothetical protein D8M57_05895 [Candidatus Scalindua sp. AMX11]|nr:MAG: hypothetical protein DWQ00_12845 [Candidatus Scalindua sp.]NOG82871.1 hypothetical protein [Planctomycetota bacterium]RZV86214.1 MAG: hypothetical protein EX341_07560 [Candidatus Scalindua sp. SCAELEC01]TDE65835.1 MAG: hypothetical protein D8M57_05895 [Candidatus Scalindua sp. AMX11]GJQ58342.1 MAG: hypothetical protein SCALA701_11430 [Candidatus Scalindua sp.]
MRDKNFFLNEKSKIAIIGGGPSGSFFAHFASRIARERGLQADITIIEGKDFCQKGPRGCNLCSGVISEKLYGGLKEQNIPLPDRCIESVIDGYCLHTQDGKLEIHHPKPLPEKKIVTVYRGNGPMYSDQSENISFDQFLLNHVESMGVKVCEGVVKDVIIPSSSQGQIKILLGKERSNKELAVDLVVGAFGLNTGIQEKIKKLGFGYIPPRTVRACQAEIYLGEDEVHRFFKNRIHILSLGIKPITYATLTPRGEYVTVALIGKTDLNKAHLHEFLVHPIIRRMFPEGWKMPKKHCICFPKIQTSLARHPFTHRFLILGDAGVSRYFKNGIESAFAASEIAARSIFATGVSEDALFHGYFEPVKKLFGSDNYYGRKIFGLNEFVTSRRRLSFGYLSFLNSNQNSPFVKKQREILWNMVTGSIPYKEVFFKACNPALQFRLIPLMVSALTKHVYDLTICGKELRHEKRLSYLENKGLGPLEDGQTVVIIGGGPAGTACAITLHRLATRRNIDIKIVLYEGKDFGKGQQFNPCVGVLSPPIEEILERDLGIPFPKHLVLENIPGYYLHSDDEEIMLEGDGEVSFAVHRILFDNYLLDKARDVGIQVIQSRVTNIDIDPSGVMVYSEKDNIRADIVVGAFGLDEGACKVFETTTRYKTPSFMRTILTKFYPEREDMGKLGNRIHAFLPSLKGIEFGAITPKIDHVDINIAGSKVNWRWMDNFLLLPQVNKVLPPNFAMQRRDLFYSRWQFPTAPAKHLFGNRYVIVGDAAGIIRAFKGKGVNTACITGIRAAEIMIDTGISKEAFKDYLKSFSYITGDRPYGKAVRFLATFSAHFGLFSPMITLAKEDKALRTALFNSVAGSKMFKRIILDAISISLIWKVTKVILVWSLQKSSLVVWIGRPFGTLLKKKKT